LLHSLTPHKVKTLSLPYCILAPEFFVAIPSPVVFSLSAVSQYMSSTVIPCPVLVLYCLIDESFSQLFPSCLIDKSSLLTGLQSSSNLLKVALHVQSRGHLVEEFIFLAVMRTILIAARTEVYLAID
jgi:hypothetical protein